VARPQYRNCGCEIKVPSAIKTASFTAFASAKRTAKQPGWASTGAFLQVTSKERRDTLASTANPKFAQVCGALGCELRVQKRRYKDRVASVLIDSGVRTSAPRMLTN